ncbi:MAG: DUF4350 domain-containing protein, partial [Deltaproteobacteria bacterium]|nr:DUF4350 domain-containing protein [Deltaproteobacteria bacterium]
MSSPRKPGVRGPLQGAFTLYIFVALLVGYTIPAHATETDYLPDNTTWNGTSALADLAAGQQLPVTLVNHLHWGDIDTRDVLFIIYPRISLHETQFLAFLRAGGHVLIADDFGSAAPLLTKLGIKRKPYTSPSTQRAAASSPRETQAFFAKNPALPIAIPARQAHPFLVGVRRVVTNHPSTFTSLLPSLLAINGEQKVLIAGRLGKGRFVALSDPSVLINSM